MKLKRQLLPFKISWSLLCRSQLFFRSRSRSHSPYRKKSSPPFRSKPYTDRPRPSRSLDNSSSTLSKSKRKPSERDKILSQWRKNYCSTREEVSSKIEELAKVSQEDIIESEKKIWTRSTPADLYYVRDDEKPKVIKSTPKLLQLCDTFNERLVLRAQKVNELKPKYEPPPRKNRARICKHKSKFIKILWFCIAATFYLTLYVKQKCKRRISDYVEIVFANIQVHMRLIFLMIVKFNYIILLNGTAF